jgi:hypothetical protein
MAHPASPPGISQCKVVERSEHAAHPTTAAGNAGHLQQRQRKGCPSSCGVAQLPPSGAAMQLLKSGISCKDMPPGSGEGIRTVSINMHHRHLPAVHALQFYPVASWIPLTSSCSRHACQPFMHRSYSQLQLRLPKERARQAGQMI